MGLNPGGLQGGSGEQYFVGRFDGARFINDNPSSLSLWTDYGKDCYCALTFNHLPASQAPVMLGWMSNWRYAAKLPTWPWRGQMTIPRELSLKTFPEGIRLVQNPVQRLKELRGSAVSQPMTNSFEIHAVMDVRGQSEAGWKLTAKDGSYVEIGYDPQKEQVFVDRTHSGLVAFSADFPARTSAPLPRKSRLSFHILVDRSSIEVFADDGRVALTNLIFPQAPPDRFTFYSGGGATSVSPVMWPLKSIWPGR